MTENDQPPSKKRQRRASPVVVDEKQVWKHDDDQWRWKHPDLPGEFYMEEGEGTWTNEYILTSSDDDDDNGTVTMSFIVNTDFEEQEEYDWETQAPPAPNETMVRKMKELLQNATPNQKDNNDRAPHYSLLQTRIATAFFNDWHGRFVHGGNSWWSDQSEGIVRETFEKASVAMPRTAEELLPMIDIGHLFVWEEDQGQGDQGFTYWVDFEVEEENNNKSGFFEEEHGLGAKFNADFECVGLSYCHGAS